MNPVRDIDPLDAIRQYCAGKPIRRLSLFGSTLHGDREPDSHIDLLVEYLPDARVGMLGIFGQQRELSEIVGGKVDLRTPKELSQYFRDEVVAEAWMIYEKESKEQSRQVIAHA